MLDTPYPFFGGKAAIADKVWEALGDVPNFVEPMFGSGAVLMRRPAWHKGKIETVNDLDGLVSNFWRAVQQDPEMTAHYADWPVNENDLTARHIWLVGQKDSLQIKLEGDPDYYDAKIAGWWAWGLSCWIGSGFCSGQGPWHSVGGQLVNGNNDGSGTWKQRVRLSGEQGVNRQLVQLRNEGEGVNRKRVNLRSQFSAGVGCVNPNRYDGLYQWFQDLSDRLRHVRVCCGDWSRVCGPSPTFALGLTGVFLDPPYSHAERSKSLYRVEMDIATAVRDWAIEAGKNPLMRVVLCGYSGEHEMPPDWIAYHWQTNGGYGLQGKGRGRENREREVVWFSPFCQQPSQQGNLGLE